MAGFQQIIAEAGKLNGTTHEVVRRLIDHYESEMAAMTEQLGQAYEELMLLYEVGEDIATTLDVGTLADRAVARMCDLLDARTGAVLLLDPSADEPHRCTPAGTAAVSACACRLLEWATLTAVERDRALILNEFGDVPDLRSDAINSLVTAPIRARGQVIGAVHVIDKRQPGGFNTQDQMLLQAIASQMGAAFENSRLFQAEQHHAQELSAAFDELQGTYDATLEALSGALDLRDNETEGHARRVTRYSVRIAEELGLGGKELVDIERGALMHDIGKIGVPDAILLKPGKLTDEEWLVMRTHPVLGHNMIRNISFLSGAAPIVLHHHERHDGDGYPDGLAGEDIPLGARIFAVADTFDAMTSDRPYRKALSYEVARDEIERCSASQFDPQVVAAFKQVAPDDWATIRERVEAELAAKRRDAEELRLSL